MEKFSPNRMKFRRAVTELWAKEDRLIQELVKEKVSWSSGYCEAYCSSLGICGQE